MFSDRDTLTLLLSYNRKQLKLMGRGRTRNKEVNGLSCRHQDVPQVDRRTS